MRKKISFIVAIFCFVFVNAQEKVTICWDASLSMKDRNIQIENEFLDDYFEKNQSIEVNLIIFNSRIIKNDTYSIQSGDWSILKKDLAKVNYDGATSYQSLAKQINGGDILLFTEGKQNIYLERPKFNGNVFVINSIPNYNRENLKLITDINSGKFINLVERDGIQGLELGSQIYFARAFNEDIGLEEIKLKINERDIESNYVKSIGAYQFNAKLGDTITFISKKNRSVRKILTKNRNVDVWIDNGDLSLDKEVILNEVIIYGKSKIKKEAEITTAFGKKNKKSVGYAIQSVYSSELIQGATNASDALRGKLIGVNRGINEKLEEAQIRGRTSFFNAKGPLIIVDGTTYGGELATLDHHTIAEVTVLKGASATAKYGSRGSEGVILITTKGAFLKKQKKKLNSPSKKKRKTVYLKALNKGRNTKESYNIYLNQREKYWSNPQYFIDVFDFFITKDYNLSYQILSNILEKENAPLAQLKAVMFKFQEVENHKMALNVSNLILELYPNLIGSYLDVAISNKNVGNYQRALNMLLAIADGSINPELNFLAIYNQVNSEIRNLIYKKGKLLNISEIDQQYLGNVISNARIMFDWNNSNSEFVIEFITPKERVLEWHHTYLENKERIIDELQLGYSKEVLELLGNEAKGEWLISVKYLGEINPDSISLFFLKCTIQFDFGKQNQRKEEYFVRFDKKGDKELIAKINIQ